MSCYEPQRREGVFETQVQSFTGAQNLEISGGSFQSAGGNIITHYGDTFVEKGDHVMETLYKYCATDATWDCRDRDRTVCHPNTRVHLLERLSQWAEGPNSARVLWLHGSVGVGKTTVARTLAAKCSAQGRLAATLFLPRSSNRGHRIIPTLAYQLAVSIPQLRPRIYQAYIEDPSVVHKMLEVQFRVLIAEPLNSLPTLAHFPNVVILDGLDEIYDLQMAGEILQGISSIKTASLEAPSLRFLVVSRENPEMRDLLSSAQFQGITQEVQLGNSKYADDEDIKTLLESGFETIRRKHCYTLKDVAQPWPGKAVITQLVSKASGQFIYASTVLRFIDDQNGRPEELLDALLGIQLLPPSHPQPFFQLDKLYHHILQNAPPHVHDLLLIVLSGLVAIAHPIPITHFELMFDLKPGDANRALKQLHSLIRTPESNPLPEGTQEPLNSSLVQILHNSFVEFLTDRDRAGKFFVDASIRLAQMALREWQRTHSVHDYSTRNDDLTFYEFSTIVLIHNLERISFVKLMQISICDVFTLNYIWRSLRLWWQAAASLSTGTLTLPYLHHFPAYRSDIFMAFVIYFWPAQDPLHVGRTWPSLRLLVRVLISFGTGMILSPILTRNWKTLRMHRALLMYLLAYMMWIHTPFLILSWLPLDLPAYHEKVASWVCFSHYQCHIACLNLWSLRVRTSVVHVSCESNGQNMDPDAP